MVSDLMIEKPTILAIDTSTSACSAALLIQTQSDPVIFESWQHAPRQHTDLILPMLDDVLQQANCNLSDVDALAFGCGPGAFTGVRIATSVIQAISYASNTNVVSISSLAALAQSIYRINSSKEVASKKNNDKVKNDICQNIVVASDARMGEVYIACYQKQGDKLLLNGEEKILKPENVLSFIEEFCTNNPQWIAVGNGWSEYESIIEPQLIDIPYINRIDDCLPHAQDIACLALEKLIQGEYGDAQTALPVYLRNNVAKKSAAQKSFANKKTAKKAGTS